MKDSVIVIEEVEQGSDYWHDLRGGVITASRAIEVVKTGRGGKGYSAARNTYMLDLIAFILTGKTNKVRSASMDWGNENEPLAREAYEMENFCIVEVPAFIFMDENKRAGFSPDGIIENNHGLEIKCPWNSSVHIDTILNGSIKPEYIHQMQFSMWVSGIERWDFCSFDPRMKEKKLHIIPIEPDIEIFKRFDDEVPKFIEEMDEKIKLILGK